MNKFNTIYSSMFLEIKFVGTNMSYCTSVWYKKYCVRFSAFELFLSFVRLVYSSSVFSIFVGLRWIRSNMEV